MPARPQTPAGARLKSKPVLPTALTSDQLKELDPAIRQRSFFSAQNLYEGVLGELRDSAASIVEGDGEIDPGSARLKVRGMLQKLGYDPEEDKDTIKDLSSDQRINLVLRTNRGIAEGVQQHLADNSPDVVEDYPAWELVRGEQRMHPRGERNEDDGWPARWEAACDQAEDAESLAVLQDTGRMIALKSSGVWQALGEGAGGYDDALDNGGIPPLAFNSGMVRDNVSYTECLELGLLDEGDELEESPIDLSGIIDLLAAAFSNERSAAPNPPKIARSLPNKLVSLPVIVENERQTITIPAARAVEYLTNRLAALDVFVSWVNEQPD
jgi:hypothetical protein